MELIQILKIIQFANNGKPKLFQEFYEPRVPLRPFYRIRIERFYLLSGKLKVERTKILNLAPDKLFILCLIMLLD